MTKDNRLIQVGCQGWNYEDWVTKPGSEKIFYPQGTRPDGMLEIYARAFESIEVDSTFYAIPSASSIEGWARRTPDSFTFSLKLPREITHELALRRESIPVLKTFCARAQLLKNRLAIVLIQMPPQFETTPENLRALREFLPLLPEDIRFAIEFRHRDWIRKSIIDLLADHRVALSLVEGQWILTESMWKAAEYRTTDFTYLRWMGERNLTRFDIVQRPQGENLKAWSEMIKSLSERVPQIYAYFSNYYEGHAPASANKLRRLLGQSTIEVSALEDQPSLF